MAVLSKIFGDANKKYLRTLGEKVADINAVENAIQSLSDEDLKAKTGVFKATLLQQYDALSGEILTLQDTIKATIDETERSQLKKQLRQLKNGPLDALIPEAFAVVREAARRTLEQRHFDVQLMGGIVLHEGQVAEMKTGEGKTLTSTLSIYLNALTGNGVHVVTVNDYLARRDAVWMGQIFNFLGLSIGVIIHEAAYVYDETQTSKSDDAQRDEGIKIEMEFLRQVERKEAYDADITYGTNNEFGFDYLRDNMVRSFDQKVQRVLNFAIVDEVDSILIDEARTPLIISAPDARSTDRYYQFATIVQSLNPADDYVVDEKLKSATLTEQGISKVEKSLGVENLYVEEGIQTVHHIEQALKAKTLFTRDKDYTVKDGQVIIVDEFTGRLLQGRRYSEGLHQAIEAKEKLEIQKESKTMATITFQNYFRLYEKLAGMTGTAETEAEELGKIYDVDVTTIPTHKPMVRIDKNDKIFKNEKGKYKAVVDAIKEIHASGQPILVGTISIEKNEYLASLLQEEGLTFNVLNAKQHEREAEIIAQAGSKGAITIATNMAGRGVDIKLGGSPFNEQHHSEIVQLGGLYVIGTERHESRRIDNQLRGRSGRQGDPGVSQFYVSLEDDLIRIFGGDRARMLMKNWPDDMPIENKIISKSIESAQKKVEGHNFDIRKHLVEYDDVANKQRTAIYALRNSILKSASEDTSYLRDLVQNCLHLEIADILQSTYQPAASSEHIKQALHSIGILLHPSEKELSDYSQRLSDNRTSDKDLRDLENQLFQKVDERFKRITEEINISLKPNDTQIPLHAVIKELYVRSIDILWVEHLETINYLRTGIGLRGYGQRDPIVEYKRESKDLFNTLQRNIQKQFIYAFMNVSITAKPALTPTQGQRFQEQKNEVSPFSGAEKRPSDKAIVSSKPRTGEGQKIGRNDPCFCGSGKKFKKCHGA